MNRSEFDVTFAVQASMQHTTMVTKQIVTPFQKFFNISSLSGALLFAATIIALIWANSPWGDIYTRLWEYKIGFTSETFEVYKPLILWVNDGLMAIFFFLIGLEIKRELLIGELNSRRKATLPLFAAIGGMVVPVVMFFLLNRNPDTMDGWGIPMATDIAFSLAILKLLGDRVPLGLKIFLTAFAIVDDIGAVFTIAVFYSENIQWGLIFASLIMLGILYFLAYKQIYVKYLIFGFGIVIWILFLKSGIHPTVAGILLAFCVPIRQKVDVRSFANRVMTISEDMKTMSQSVHPVLTREQIYRLDDLEYWTSKVQSPLQHLEHRLHGWVAYLIIPVFAFANAGIVFEMGPEVDMQLALIIAVCLVVGKCIGIPLMTWLSMKLKLTELPKGVSFSQIIGVGLLAGIGFTMSIFIATLAFADNPDLVNSAKIGILIGSVVAAAAGYLVLRWSTTSQPVDPAEDP